MIPLLLDMWKSGKLAGILKEAPVVQPGPKKPAQSPRAAQGSSSGWSTVKPKRPDTSSQRPEESLVGEGWSVPVIPKLEDLHADTPGVCLCATALARG